MGGGRHGNNCDTQAAPPSLRLPISFRVSMSLSLFCLPPSPLCLPRFLFVSLSLSLNFFVSAPSPLSSRLYVSVSLPPCPSLPASLSLSCCLPLIRPYLFSSLFVCLYLPFIPPISLSLPAYLPGHRLCPPHYVCPSLSLCLPPPFPPSPPLSPR